MTHKQKRSPDRVYSVGQEPDPRFSFANERTFLAWIRTCLALIAAGVALDMFGGPKDETARSWLAGIIIAVGILCSLGAYAKWMAAERAMRLDAPLPAMPLGRILVAVVVLVGLGVGVLVLTLQ
jgi:inner membrane protein YidH